MRERLIVKPGKPANLAKRDARDGLGLEGKDEGKELLGELIEELALLQNRLWAEGERSLLLVLQGLDASGKDGTIRSVFTGVNPQGCQVVSFKAPSSNERAHDYLWRVHDVCPARGRIGIFNRSHYEDVVAVRVRELAPKRVWSKRPGHINDFERMLTDEGTTIVKVYLHLSNEEQRERLQERVDNPEKRWKFRAGDLDDRALWGDYMKAFEETITETSTKWAPWYVVPTDRNWVRNVAVASLLVETLRELDPKIPDPEEGIAGTVVK
ncbi:MAG: polyphosphate kinase 2 family protein [Gaiellaceae bacterium]